MKTRLLFVLAFFAFQCSFAKGLVVDPVAPSDLPSLSYCDPNNDGFGSFNLTDQNTAILAAQSGSASDYAITYHQTFTDANIGANPISSPYFNINAWNEVVYYRIRNINTSTFAVGQFQLIVNPRPVVTNPNNIVLCDNDNDGMQLFDLTSVTTEVLASIDPSTVMVTFHNSQTGAIAGVSPIIPANSYNGTNGETVYVRVANNATGCYSIVSFHLIVNAAPFANGPQNYSECDNYGNPFNGEAVVDLTQFAPAILNGQNPVTHQIQYYATQADAIFETNQISLSAAQNYNTPSTTIWVKVINSSGCYSLTTIDINISASPTLYVNTPNNIRAICVDYISGVVTQSLTLDSGVANPSAFTFEWYEDGNLVGTSPTYTVDTALPNGATRTYTVHVTVNNGLGCSSSSSGFAVGQSGPPAITPSAPNGYTVVNLSGVQSIIISISGYGLYEYSLDNGSYQLSNVFDNVTLGNHQVHVRDIEGGCGQLIINDILIAESEVPAPSGMTSQTFDAGSTLANIAVSGTNIQWYASASNKTNLTMNAVPLPLNTILVDGTTYYATQTIGSIESVARLPVTIHLNLGIGDNEVLPIQYAPNPVKDNLTLQSTVVLKSVTAYTMLGQKVLEQNCNGIDVTVDLSRLSSGNYILKVEGETGQKTIRIIKE